MTRTVAAAAAALALAALGTAALGTATAGPAAADAKTIVPDAQYSATAKTWPQAASLLGTAGSLWQPTQTLKLRAPASLSVQAGNLVVVNGAVQRGGEFLPATSVGGQYGTTKRGFTIAEKWANTAWAADPVPSWHRAPVGTASVDLKPHDPATPNPVKVRVYANCWKPSSMSPSVPPKGFRCTKADVKAHGGYAILTAKPASTMTAPGTTSVWIESDGLTYDELLKVVGGLAQVTGSPDQGVGGAMQQATCRQMVDGKMNEAQAASLAQGNGYTTRVVQRDGQDLPMTMDWRPERIDIAVTNGIVIGCPLFG